MNGQEIIEMGMLAGLCDEEGRDDASIIITDHMTRFAKLVAAKKQAECEKAIEQSRAYELVWYPEGYSISPNKINSFYEFQWERSMEAIKTCS